MSDYPEIKQLHFELKELADENKRLRSRLRLADSVIRSGAVAALTDEERQAIAGAIESEHGRGAFAWAATLRKLLERLG